MLYFNAKLINFPKWQKTYLKIPLNSLYMVSPYRGYYISGQELIASCKQQVDECDHIIDFHIAITVNVSIIEVDTIGLA